MARYLRYLSRFWPIVLLLLPPQGCSQVEPSRAAGPTSQRIRVRLIESASSVQVGAGGTVQLRLDSSTTPRLVRIPAGATLNLSGNVWQLGGVALGQGILTMQVDTGDLLRVNKIAYRGIFRFFPVGADRFDAVNDLDVDDYLDGVVAAEMYRNWQFEAFKAQAVVARTYALYDAHSSGVSRYWDVYPDQRSQMYGGTAAETELSRQAVMATSGLVLTYGPGDGKIFKAYFTSCCGGVSQAAADAFPGDPYIMPLSEQYRGPCCNASKYFNWGPITVGKEELSRRFHLWAINQSRLVGRAIPETNMGMIDRMEVQTVNRYGRPSRVLITDDRGTQYSLAAEQMRAAVNTDAAVGTTLPSSFCKINGGSNSSVITFYEGHGYGHGVGMCQYCAEAEAAEGEHFDQILLAAYPTAKIVRAY
jgi:stage II sporulation protein D (peptidoglycan lytic transglycosylase)